MNRVKTVSRVTLVLAAIVALHPPTARAEQSGPLAAPAKDVGAVAEALTKRGFTVTRVENLATVKELDEAVKAFARTVPTDGTALVYFSGNTAIAAIPQAMKPARQEVALTTLDGAKHPISAVLRPIVVPPGYAPYGHGWQGPQSGSRINVLIVDAPSPLSLIHI